VLYTDTPWLQMPYRELGLPSGESCRRRLDEWSRRRLFQRAIRLLQEQLAGADKLDWSRVIVDASLVDAKRVREGRATLRGCAGSRFHLAVDANASPLKVRLAAGMRTSADTCSAAGSRARRARVVIRGPPLRVSRASSPRRRDGGWRRPRRVTRLRPGREVYL
jgi:hypothetical protein